MPYSEERRSRSHSSSGSSYARGEDREYRSASHDGYRLHVADLSVGVTKQDLERLYDKYGPMKEIWLARSPPCFAFVVYRYKDDAEDAMRATDGLTLQGSRIRVTFALPRTRGRGRRGFDPQMRCYQCGEKGHFSRDCPGIKYGYKRPPSRSPARRRGHRGRRHSVSRSRSRSPGRYRRY